MGFKPNYFSFLMHSFYLFINRLTIIIIIFKSIITTIVTNTVVAAVAAIVYGSVQ